MAVYVVTGKLGSGKTLVAVGKIQEKLVSGCKVATNLDLRIHLFKIVVIQARSPGYYVSRTNHRWMIYWRLVKEYILR
ncbi:zonular occludens toxin domain-containing protein [Dickeya fangzhongdai]|uniref:zonular occludens toxin domain-containing protein n=1 Tax=Dickeya fangzhongdai TaxID=1778540 RepID=UPI0026DFCAC7|nr:zonular occludens toxin domain-containing protein [Dickeya fangzhongdai]